MKHKELCIQRCFDLSKFGRGKVSPNPCVGAVITTDNNVIGEGFHKAYGSAHAEVNAVKNAIKNNSNNFQDSHIFVSLEPCNIYGQTPPCTNLIIEKGIPNVYIASIDQTKGVNFEGIKKLEQYRHQVQFGILKQKGDFIARVRNTFVRKKRPYIILKFAQSWDGFIGRMGEHIWLSNAYSKRLVHRWRAESSAIMVGKNTALNDNPRLNNRHYAGKNPVRIVIDRANEIPDDYNLKDGSIETWFFHKAPTSSQKFKSFPIQNEGDELKTICQLMYDKKMNTLFVEGGAQLLQSCIDQGLWDEARVFSCPKLLQNGIPSPTLNGLNIANFKLANDRLDLIINPENVINS